MTKIIAYKSEEDNKIFELEKDYNAHLELLIAKKKFADKIISDTNNSNIFLQKMFNNVKNVDEIVEFIENNKDFFILNKIRQMSSHDLKKIKIEKIIFDKISIVSKPSYSDLQIAAMNSLKWDNKISMSHSAPIGMSTNWGGENLAMPSSCPGWTGKINYRLQDSKGFASDIFKSTGLNLGSGGSGSGKNMFSFGLVVYAADFKKMAFVSLLEDYVADKKLDFIRIQYVLDIATNFIEWDNQVFIEMIEDLNIKNPKLSSYILNTKISSSNNKNKQNLIKI